MGQDQAPLRALDVFRQRVKATPDRPALRYVEQGVWHTLTWRQWDETARMIAGGLRSLGIAAGARIALLSSSRREWSLADVAIVMAGCVSVPNHPSDGPDHWAHVIIHSGAVALFVEDQALLAQLAQAGSSLPPLSVILFSGPLPPRPAFAGPMLSLSALQESGRAWIEAHPGVLESDGSRVKPSDPFTIVYTSGTTGRSKGVVLTHDNAVFQSRAFGEAAGIDGSDTHLMVLSLAGVFARILEWSAIWAGAVTAFGAGPSRVLADMQSLRPTYMGAAPLTHQKHYATFRAWFEEQRQSRLRGRFVDWALAAGRRHAAARRAGRSALGLRIRRFLADRVVLARARRLFGGDIKFFISGGAKLAPEIAEFFHAIGVVMLEGYGLTETFATVTLDRRATFRIGSVGRPLTGAEVMIDEDGEILARGRNVFREYWADIETTRAAFDDAGWFRTGDVGEIDRDGYLHITDRKKDLIVLNDANKVAPQVVENAVKSNCIYVSQVVLFGDGRDFLTALITLNEETMARWVREHGRAGASIADLAADREVTAMLQRAVDAGTAGLPPYMRIAKFAVLPGDLSRETGELTATLKVRRRSVAERYRSVIDALYAPAVEECAG